MTVANYRDEYLTHWGHELITTTNAIMPNTVSAMNLNDIMENMREEMNKQLSDDMIRMLGGNDDRLSALAYSLSVKEKAASYQKPKKKNNLLLLCDA